MSNSHKDKGRSSSHKDRGNKLGEALQLPGSDDRREEGPPGAQNDLSRSCAGCQDKNQQ
jgi:hypothetical protein